MESGVDDISIAEAVKVSPLGLDHERGICVALNIPLRELLCVLITQGSQLFGRLLLDSVDFGSESIGFTLAVTKGKEKMSFSDDLRVGLFVYEEVLAHRIECGLLVRSDWIAFEHWSVAGHLEIWVLKLG